MKSTYLDHGASTPVRPEVLEAMRPFWSDVYANPSSVHRAGRQASRALENAREQIAALINAKPAEILFTGCGSESDNLALRGVMWAARAAGRGEHLITSAVEHKAVLDTARQLRDQYGFELTVLPVDEFGRVSPEALEAAIRPVTSLISIMAANNEIGTLLPIEALGEIAHRRGVLFHSDAIQAVFSREWDVQRLPADLLSFAPHKFYGPKGIGILYVRQGAQLAALITGGGQEGGRRAGTENVAYAVGAAEALRLALEEREELTRHATRLRDRLIEGVLAAAGEVGRLTGHPAERTPHNASFAFRGISGNDLLMHLDMAGVAASSGSACLTGDPKPSDVLEASGLGPEWTRGGLRLTVGRQNTPEEIEHVLRILPPILDKLRQLSLQYA
ncbi:MAG: cysteine desulfurase family protein [Candidatus Promineifilaceae bacterium]